MTPGDDHYRRTITQRGATRFARCGYQDRFDPFRLSRLPRLRALYEGLFRYGLDAKPCERLLDVGCGTGLYFEALVPFARQIDALDASWDMLRVAREFCQARNLNQLRLSVGALEALPYPNAVFDAVVALDTLHHVDDVETSLAEIGRVLKIGGRLVVFEPNILNPLMLAAHAFPREERRALGRNRPAVLRKLLERRFHTVAHCGICDLITETEGVRRALLDAYVGLFRLLGVEAFYPRQCWVVEKRGGG